MLILSLGLGARSKDNDGPGTMVALPGFFVEAPGRNRIVEKFSGVLVDRNLPIQATEADGRVGVDHFANGMKFLVERCHRTNSTQANREYKLRFRSKTESGRYVVPPQRGALRRVLLGQGQFVPS